MRNRLGLWVGLVVLFGVFFQFFRHGGADSALAPWSPLLFVALFVVFFFLNARKLRVRNAKNLRALALLSQGRFSEATKAFEAVDEVNPSSVNPAVSLYYLGLCKLSLWRLTEAEAIFGKALARPTDRFKVSDLSSLILPSQALTLATLGRAAEARGCIDAATRGDLGQMPAVLLAGVVLEAREGHWEAVRTGLRQNEIKQLGGPPRGLAEALGAWTVEQLTGERRPVDQVALFGEAGPDAFAKAWPAFDAFLKRALLE